MKFDNEIDEISILSKIQGVSALTPWNLLKMGIYLSGHGQWPVPHPLPIAPKISVKLEVGVEDI